MPPNGGPYDTQTPSIDQPPLSNPPHHALNQTHPVQTCYPAPMPAKSGKHRQRKLYTCTECGGIQSRWAGKCPDCGSWDTLEETTPEPDTPDQHRPLATSFAETETHAGHAPRARPICEVSDDDAHLPRIPTSIAELDRVLGTSADNAAGIVPGSVVLIGGDPGIGKSTLMLQAAAGIARTNHRVLYVSSEESEHQIKLRAARLHADNSPDLFVLADTNLARIIEQTRKTTPSVLIIDSVQMIYKPDLPASPGSVTQLRRCAAELVYLAKSANISVLLVGHVTKDGQLAGPRLLEHLVDAVLSFEGDRYHARRLVRAVKNRFGTTLELGVFEMGARGLEQVTDGLILRAQDTAENDSKSRIGTVICPAVHGSRTVIVELQALTATGFLGAAKRKCSGLDANRLAMVIAVLEQHAELRLADRDIFVSSAAGLRITEPAADLALLLAIAGAHMRRPLDPATAVVGEVGLAGEVRPVTQLEQRVREATRLGFKRIILPAGARVPCKDAQLVPVSRISQAMEQLG